MKRGLEPELARTVARANWRPRWAFAAHARDELGLIEELAARPLQAAVASAGTFAIGAAVLVLTILLAPTDRIVAVVSAVSLVCRRDSRKRLPDHDARLPVRENRAA